MASRAPGERKAKHAAHPFLWDDTTLSRTELLRARGMLPAPPPPPAHLAFRRAPAHRPRRSSHRHAA